MGRLDLTRLADGVGVLTDADKRRIRELEAESERYRELSNSAADARLRRTYLRNAARMEKMAKAQHIFPLGVWARSMRLAILLFVVLLPYALTVRLGGPSGFGLIVSAALGALVYAFWRRSRPR